MIEKDIPKKNGLIKCYEEGDNTVCKYYHHRSSKGLLIKFKLSVPTEIFNQHSSLDGLAKIISNQHFETVASDPKNTFPYKIFSYKGYKPDGSPYLFHFFRNKKYHSFADQPALIKWNFIFNQIENIIYYHDGVIHRPVEFGPCRTNFRYDYSTLPATKLGKEEIFIDKDKDNYRIIKTYGVNKKTDDYILVKVQHSKNNKSHCEDGPAEICYNSAGEIQEEIYLINGDYFGSNLGLYDSVKIKEFYENFKLLD